ncbi:hypothetical protein B7L68_08395 [Thermoproteus sp. CP80]|nr:hypothetical protein B7L68_08395 [Thermoproteus sp. CP80]
MWIIIIYLEAFRSRDPEDTSENINISSFEDGYTSLCIIIRRTSPLFSPCILNLIYAPKIFNNTLNIFSRYISVEIKIYSMILCRAFFIIKNL